MEESASEVDWYRPPQEAAGSSVGEASAEAGEPAGLWIRAAARAIDSIFGIFRGFLLALLLGAVYALTGNQPKAAGSSLPITLLAFAIGLVEQALAESIGGATLGKAVLGLRVRTESLERCSFLAALARNALYFLDVIICGMPGCIVLARSARKQRLGDRAAGTVVVRARSLSHRQSPLRGILLGAAAWTVGVVFLMLFGETGLS